MIDEKARMLAGAIAAAMGAQPPFPIRLESAPPPVRVLRCVFQWPRSNDAAVTQQFGSQCPRVRTCSEMLAEIGERGNAAAFLREVLRVRDIKRAAVLAEVLAYLVNEEGHHKG